VAGAREVKLQMALYFKEEGIQCVPGDKLQVLLGKGKARHGEFTTKIKYI